MKEDFKVNCIERKLSIKDVSEFESFLSNVYSVQMP